MIHARRNRQAIEAEAGARRRMWGHITSMLFLVVALAMAATALHREQQLAPQERQALESLR